MARQRKRQFLRGMDDYATALDRFESRLSEACAAEIDGWHRLIVKVEGGVLIKSELQLTEEVVAKGIDTEVGSG